jgi:hypothetical protein
MSAAALSSRPRRARRLTAALLAASVAAALVLTAGCSASRSGAFDPGAEPVAKAPEVCDFFTEAEMAGTVLGTVTERPSRLGTTDTCVWDTRPGSAPAGTPFTSLRVQVFVFADRAGSAGTHQAKRHYEELKRFDEDRFSAEPLNGIGRAGYIYVYTRAYTTSQAVFMDGNVVSTIYYTRQALSQARALDAAQVWAKKVSEKV